MSKIKMQVGIWYDLNIIVRNEEAALVQMRKMADGAKEFRETEIIGISVDSDNEATELIKTLSDKIFNNYE